MKLLVLCLLAAGLATAANAATPADRVFVAKVSQGGMYEVAAGRLAETRGSTQDLRDFATAEVHDHTLVGDKLKAISAREGVPIASTPTAKFAGKLSRLRDLNGPAFDRAYLADMAALHDADGGAFAKEASGGGSAAFRAFGAETHRIVQRHIGAIQGGAVTRVIKVTVAVAWAIAVLPAPVAAQVVQPGAWDVTSTVVDLSVPGVPGFMQRLARGKSRAEHKRLAAGDGVAALLAPDPKAHCRVDSQMIDAGRYAQALTCPQAKGEPLRIERVGTYDAAGFSGRATVAGITPRGVLSMALRQRAARVGG